MRYVTIKEIARESGFSPMTVSYALRESPRIAAKTRAHIQAVAKRLGYVPDPDFGAVMSRMRRARHGAYQGQLVILNCFPDRTAFRYEFMNRLVRGAISRAPELGYQVEEFWLGDPGLTSARASSILFARGVRGILIPPLPQKQERVDLEWEKFCSLAVSRSVVYPRLSLVAPDHFNDKVRLFEHLARLGYQRLGLLTTDDYEHRENHAPLAVWGWYHSEVANKTPIPAFRNPPDHPGFVKWFEKHKPDCLLAPTDEVLPAIERLLCGKAPKNFGFAAFSNTYSDVTGIDVSPDRLGRSAVEALVAMIQRGEAGIPTHPKLIQLPGDLVVGRTTRKSPPHRR